MDDRQGRMTPIRAVPQARTLRSAEDLEQAGLIDSSKFADVEDVAQRYAVAISPAMAALIDRDDPSDPIAKQFVPDVAELTTMPGESEDPIGDLSHSPVEGIVHRYPDRVLLKAVHVCPVYCRFCFRREMVGPQGLGTLAPDALDRAFDYIASHPEIWEVILTGGDPLVLSPRRLGELARRLGEVGHVRVVRFHSRVPVVEPERIDAEMIDALKASRRATYVAVHANHPRELTQAARVALSRIAEAGIVLLGQSVLLRGVNDDPDVLADLMRGFVEARVKPYYLHHPDLAPGTGHFRLSIEEGQAIVAALRGRISGLCQPTYVLDIPGGFGKAPIARADIAPDEDGSLRIRDFRGTTHGYPPRPI